MTTQPEALRLADRLEGRWALHPEMQQAAAELRRQHSEIESLRQAYNIVTDDRRNLTEKVIPNIRAERDALRAERDALVRAMKEVSTFLDHCWRDVQMNDFSFEWLERMIAAIDAARSKT